MPECLRVSCAVTKLGYCVKDATVTIRIGGDRSGGAVVARVSLVSNHSNLSH